MIQISRKPGEGKTRYQQRIATTRALEAYVERVKKDPVHIEITQLMAALDHTAVMAKGDRA